MPDKLTITPVFQAEAFACNNLYLRLIIKILFLHPCG